jgi:uncharacterized protein YaeQ
MTESILLNCDMLLMNNINTTKKTLETVIGASKEVGLEVSTEKAKHAWMPRHQNLERNQDMKVANIDFENVEKLKYLGRRVTNQKFVHEGTDNKLNREVPATIQF